MSYVVVAIAALLAVVASLYAMLEIRYSLGRRRIAADWQRRSIEPLEQIGATRTLEILPLIDWYTGRAQLRSEAGVSYLIKTDHATLLLDVGLNLHRANPSPLLHNMHELGVDLQDCSVVAARSRVSSNARTFGFDRISIASRIISMLNRDTENADSTNATQSLLIVRTRVRYRTTARRDPMRRDSSLSSPDRPPRSAACSFPRRPCARSRRP